MIRITIQFFGGRGTGGIGAIYGGSRNISRSDIVSTASAKGYEPVPNSEFRNSTISDDNIGKKFVISQEGTPWTYNPMNPAESGGQSVNFVEATYEGNGQFRPTGEGSVIDINNSPDNTIVFRRKRK